MKKTQKANKSLLKILIYVLAFIAFLAFGALGLAYRGRISIIMPFVAKLITSKEMIVKGCAKDATTKSVIPNPKVTIYCQTTGLKNCESFPDGNFACKTRVLEGDQCRVSVLFQSSISGKIKEAGLGRYLSAQPNQTIDLGDLFVPLESKEKQIENVEAYNLSEEYLNAFIKKNWKKIEALGVDCGLDRTLVDNYGLKGFIRNSVGGEDNAHSHSIDLRDCTTGCDIQKNISMPFTIYLQKDQATSQWECWSESR